MLTIENTQGFSGIAPITLSRGFSVEILTEITLLWKTKLNRNISAIEDATLLEGAERSQIVGSKHKEVPLGNDVDYQSSKKTKGKQPARY